MSEIMQSATVVIMGYRTKMLVKNMSLCKKIEKDVDSGSRGLQKPELQDLSSA